jgi:hypothetical protein
LFNFWGIQSAQSMAVVTPEWKFVYWYYAGDSMKPTEELFHRGQDRFETTTFTNDPHYVAELETMRRYYDIELAAIRTKVVTGHDHETYPVLFDRSIAWDQKTPLLKTQRARDAAEDQDEGEGKRKNREGKKGKTGGTRNARRKIASKP